MTKHQHHVVIRTSPKGKGMKFIGKCSLCGKEGLPASAVMQYCDNPQEVSEEEAIVSAILGGKDDAIQE